MWATIALVSVAALGAVWGSKHPEAPFKDFGVSAKNAVSGLFKKDKNKEKSNDDSKENQ